MVLVQLRLQRSCQLGQVLTGAVRCVSELTHMVFARRPHFFAGRWQDSSISPHMDFAIVLLESRHDMAASTRASDMTEQGGAAMFV